MSICYKNSYCYDLGAINIPDSVTYIGYRAFYNCLSLTKITCNAEVPPVCGYEAFYDVPSSATLYVPDSAIEEYKETSPWNNFANIVRLSEKEDDGIVKMTENKKEDSCYDLQGREIIHPLKGIFIKNGKKVFVP